MPPYLKTKDLREAYVCLHMSGSGFQGPGSALVSGLGFQGPGSVAAFLGSSCPAICAAAWPPFQS